MARQKIRRKYGHMIQLKLEHMTEYIRNYIAKKSKNASVVTANDQSHLNNMILLVQLISLVLFLVCQSYPGFLRIRLIYKPEFCYNGTNCSYQIEELLFRPSEAYAGYRGIWESLQRVTKRLPQYAGEDKEIGSLREEIKTYWMVQLSVWPLEPMCIIIILAMDVVRRSFCRRLQKRDTTVMFSMTGLMLCLCVLRICGIYLYFAILRRANVMAQKINYRSSGGTQLKDLPIILCVEPPGNYFVLSLINLFFTLIQITFAMDYLDPN
ncbi:hypothetical protein CRM22_004292 [Opisthorchis felineus]|uniref:Uncharacterized protein n=1 Tax=Opisthorchis felineus TaxID=147828 RepID=A0A4S2M2Z8_OPIFE|nr:hypothetical protein CRM22_004292 [Opisthorchis felineus]